MQAVVFHDVGDIGLDKVADPGIQSPSDAVIRITHSAICGTDLHMVRGTLGGMKAGTILGHEAVGVVEDIGAQVRNLNVGDRVVVPSTIACGHCAYCRDGYYAQCDVANPNGSLAGSAFFGGPAATGSFDGLQAEYARIPYASTGLVKLPQEVDDYDALMVSDIVPTGYFGAHMAAIKPGMSVAVFGCGPVGLFAIVSAQLMGAGRVLAIDHCHSRLEMARAQGAEIINFDEEGPIEVIRDLTGGVGVDRVIDAVGVDADAANSGPTAEAQNAIEQPSRAGAGTDASPDQRAPWQAGTAPSQVLEWAVNAVAKAGLISILGVYGPEQTSFPIGSAMQRNLSLRMGNCNHRRYIPELLGLVRSGALRPRDILTQTEPLMNVLEAYEAFDRRDTGWIKVALDLG